MREVIKIVEETVEVRGLHGLRLKKLYTSVAVTLAPVRVPSQQPLVPSSHWLLARLELLNLPSYHPSIFSEVYLALLHVLRNIMFLHRWEDFSLPLFSTVVPSQETEVTLTPTRPVDNVVIVTKGLQDRNINILAGTTVENKGKFIITCTSLSFYGCSTLKGSLLKDGNLLHMVFGFG